jgi:threonine dehydratase
MNPLPTLADVQAARARIAGHVPRTPLIEAPLLAADLGLSALWLKAEGLLPSGAFKLRGATNFLRLHAERAAAGVITYSSGNHAIAMAMAAQQLGVPRVVVVPTDVNSTKLALIRRFGAEVHRAGTTSAERKARAEELATERGLLMMPPFDDPAIVAGQGTVGLELAEDLPAGVDTVLVPCGGGGLLSGTALALSALRPEIEIVVVEPAEADAMTRSLEADQLVAIQPGPTLADGLKPTAPGSLNLALCRGRVRRGIRVQDPELLEAVRQLAWVAHLVVEPSGAAPLAAILREPGAFAGRRVALVLSGSNIDPGVLRQALA